MTRPCHTITTNKHARSNLPNQLRSCFQANQTRPLFFFLLFSFDNQIIRFTHTRIYEYTYLSDIIVSIFSIRWRREERKEGRNRSTRFSLIPRASNKGVPPRPTGNPSLYRSRIPRRPRRHWRGQMLACPAPRCALIYTYIRSLSLSLSFLHSSRLLHGPTARVRRVGTAPTLSRLAP